MCKDEKLQFIDKVVALLSKFCPQMSEDVLYWVACQSALESNYGRSRIAKVNNNIFGMKSPQSRLTLCKSSVGFAKYDSIEDCVLDYVYWLCWRKFNCFELFDLNQYTRQIISSGYCPEKDYVDKIYQLFNSLKTTKLCQTK